MDFFLRLTVLSVSQLISTLRGRKLRRFIFSITVYIEIVIGLPTFRLEQNDIRITSLEGSFVKDIHRHNVH